MVDPIKAQVVDCKNCSHYEVCEICKDPEFLGFVDKLNKIVDKVSDKFDIKVMNGSDIIGTIYCNCGCCGRQVPFERTCPAVGYFICEDCQPIISSYIKFLHDLVEEEKNENE